MSFVIGAAFGAGAMFAYHKGYFGKLLKWLDRGGE